MKRLLIFLVILSIAGYAGWPLYSMYQIYNGLKPVDEPLLTRKVDWPSVRVSFKEAIKPYVANRIESEAEKFAGNSQGLSVKQMAVSMAPKVVDQIVDSYMTPKGLARLAATGGRINLASTGLTDMLAKLTSPTQTGDGQSTSGFGGLLQKAKEAMEGVPGAREKLREMIGGGQSSPRSSGDAGNSDQAHKDGEPSYSIDNIKTIRFNSITEFELGVAKKPAAEDPDLTMVMGFREFDWKLIKLIPRLQ